MTTQTLAEKWRSRTWHLIVGFSVVSSVLAFRCKWSASGWAAVILAIGGLWVTNKVTRTLALAKVNGNKDNGNV